MLPDADQLDRILVRYAGREAAPTRRFKIEWESSQEGLSMGLPKKLLLLFVGATALAGLVWTGAAVGEDEKTDSSIPEEAVEFDGHHYLLVDEVEGLSWPSSKKRCASQGSHLATVTSREESDFIAELCDGRYMYLGGSDEEQEGNWVWVDGSPWEFTNWMRGQPNDYTGNEDYLATYDHGAWVDVDAEGDDFWMPTGYICEWDE